MVGVTGPFIPSKVSTSIFQLTPVSIVIADFNGDRIQDIAVSSVDGTINVMLNTDQGYISSPALNADGYGTLIAADFNGDGIPDLAVPGVNSIAIFLGKGDGTFSLTPSPSVANVQGFEVADFNNDGISDLVVTHLIDNQPSSSYVWVRVMEHSRIPSCQQLHRLLCLL